MLMGVVRMQTQEYRETRVRDEEGQTDEEAIDDPPARSVTPDREVPRTTSSPIPESTRGRDTVDNRIEEREG